MTKELVPIERPTEVVSVDDMLDGLEAAREREAMDDDKPDRADALDALDSFTPGAGMLDPILAQEREAERQRLAGPRSRVTADTIGVVPHKAWESTGALWSSADGALDQPADRTMQTLAHLRATVRVDKDGRVRYGVDIRPHDLRIKRVFVR